MTVTQLMALTDCKVLTADDDLSREVLAGYSCDLLSWVMSHGAAGMAWITVQTHMNVIAVAALLDMACVILPEGIADMPEAVIAKANEEGITVLTSNKTAYELCGILYGEGLRNAQRL